MSCKVISHRGANLHAPQNTLPAFEKAMQIGVDGFETDIHVTKDGVPVVCHNYTIDETSTGKGLVCEMTLEELRQYDFGSYFSEDFKDVKIPTLDEFLELSKKADIEILNIELKSPKQANSGIVEKTISAVKAHGLWDKLLISSFDANLLVEAKKIDATCKTALLYSPLDYSSKKLFFNAAGYAASLKCDALHPHFSSVTPLYVWRAHRKNIKVNVWTVDKSRTARWLKFCKADSIITNYPELIKKIVNK